jgi:hypothetical protein
MTGYKGGSPLPEPSVAANVADFGAVGDGETDDTAAILQALNSIDEGALYFPPGRYLLTDRIRVTQSGVVLRGAGSDETTLVIPKSLEQIEGESDFIAQGQKKTNYSFGGGFVEFNGRETCPMVTIVREDAPRGDKELVLGDASSFSPGDRIKLVMAATPEHGRHLHAGIHDMGESTAQQKNLVSWVSGISEVNGNTITLDRPLRYDVRYAWKPRIFRFTPTLEEVGIEGFTFVFAGRPKRAHLQEEGFNAIQFTRASNGWVRDVRIIDADMGIKLHGARFCTIQNVVLEQHRRTGMSEGRIDGITGHHALWAAMSAQDNLFQNFQINTRFHHDISVEWFANGNVFRNGRGVMLNLDHHRMIPYENLFSNLKTDDVSRLWDSSGRKDRGPNAGARATFWNIQYQTGTLQYWGTPERPFPDDWPEINVIGLRGVGPAPEDSHAWVVAQPEGEFPPDLYSAQRTWAGLSPTP